jgi:hypothetical protein
MIDMGLAYQELKELSANKIDKQLDEQCAISNAPTGMTTLTNSSSTLYLTSGAVNRAEMTGGNVSSPPAIHKMIGQSAKPHQGEYITRLKSFKNGRLPIIESSSANAPDMTEMYHNMLPGSSDESFSDSDYHSSDGNSFMEIEDGGSDPSSSSSSSSESSSDSSSSSSDSSSDTSSSSSERSGKRKKSKKRK